MSQSLVEVFRCCGSSWLSIAIENVGVIVTFREGRERRELVQWATDSTRQMRDKGTEQSRKISILPELFSGSIRKYFQKNTTS